jgi:hypothetical protein
MMRLFYAPTFYDLAFYDPLYDARFDDAAFLIRAGASLSTAEPFDCRA